MPNTSPDDWWVIEMRDRTHELGSHISRVEGLLTGAAVRIATTEQTLDAQGVRLSSLEKFRYMATGALTFIAVTAPIASGVAIWAASHSL